MPPRRASAASSSATAAAGSSETWSRGSLIAAGELFASLHRGVDRVQEGGPDAGLLELADRAGRRPARRGDASRAARPGARARRAGASRCRASSARRASSRSRARGRAGSRPRSSPRRGARSTRGPSRRRAVIASICSSGTSTTSPTARSTVPARSRCSRPACRPAHMPAIPSWTVEGAFGIERTTGTSRGDVTLDPRGRDRGRDREDRLLGGEQVADLAEQRLDVLRLDGEHDDVGAADRVGVRGRRLDAVPLAELVGPLLAPRGRDDVGPVGATQPGEERLADLAGAEDRDSHAASLRVRRRIPPAGTRSRARPTRRRARAGRPSPRPRRAVPRAPTASLTRPRSRARPRS